MKITAVVLGILGTIACGSPIFAGTLLTGAVRDADGRAVPGASVRVLDSSGSLVGRDVVAPDGTFAVDAGADAAMVEVDCTYCERVRVPIRGEDEPVVVIVRRHAALLERTPSAGDLSVLPYRQFGDVATLVPYTVTNGAGVSDRGLNGGRGAVTIDGLPFYGIFNGIDPALSVPSHGVGSLFALSPLTAARYGAYANGGTYGVLTAAGPARFDAGDASDVILRGSNQYAHAAADNSNEPNDHRTLQSAGITLPFAGGLLDVSGLRLTAFRGSAEGAAVHYATASRRYATFASVEATQSAFGGAFDTVADGDVRADVHVRNRGPLGLELGARVRRSSGSFIAGMAETGGTQRQDAVYADAQVVRGRSAFSATAALQHDDDGGVVQANALVASLSYDTVLGRDWTVHAGIANNVRPPSLAEFVNALAPTLDRSGFEEFAVQYSDQRRLRLQAMTYAETIAGVSDGYVDGVGIDGAWQIAPHLSLRGWKLHATNRSSTPYSTLTPIVTTSSAALTGNLLWLTYDNGVRIDALTRGGGLEGDVFIPLAHGRSGLLLGTLVRNGQRLTTLGLRLP